MIWLQNYGAETIASKQLSIQTERADKFVGSSGVLENLLLTTVPHDCRWLAWKHWVRSRLPFRG